MYYFNPFAIPPLLTAFVILTIGSYILIKNPRSLVHRGLTFFCASLTIWLLGYTAMYSSTDPHVALKWARFGFVGIAFIAVSNLYFNLNLIKILDKRLFVISLVLVSIVLAAFGMTPFIYSGTKKYFWGYYPVAGQFYPSFMIYYVLTWLYGLHLLWQKMGESKKNKDFLTYNQIKYVFIAWAGGSLGIVDFLPKYGIPVYPFAYLISVYWVLVSAISILHYRTLTDLSFLSRRFLIFSCFSLGFGLIGITGYMAVELIQGYISTNREIIHLVFAILLGVFAQKLYLKSRNVVDQFFFPEYLERKERLAQLGQAIILSRNSVEFNRILLENIFSVFKIVQSSFFIYDSHENKYMMSSSIGWGSKISGDGNISYSKDSAIVEYLHSHECLNINEISNDYSVSQYREINLRMYEIGGVLCIPIWSEGNMVGFFVFGDKESGLPYSRDDIRVLQTLAMHTAVAIEKIYMDKKWQDEQSEKQRVTNMLHRYLSPTVADEILRQVNRQQNWKGERRHVSVLVSDLRGFSQISDNYPPEQVTGFLNEFFSEMIPVIESYNGSVDKFMGDAILVVFGAPRIVEDSEFNAVSCAVDMQAAMRALNRKRREKGSFTLGMGIGISAGEVVAGNIGSDKRMEYAVIGDPVNMAARLQEHAEAGKIKVSNNVFDCVANRVLHVTGSPFKIKGKTNLIDNIEIVSLLPQSNKDIWDIDINRSQSM